MLLYDTAEAHTPGQILREQSSCGFAPRNVLAAWAGGQAPEQHMPEGVGLELPSAEAGRALLLEVHYFNSEDAAPDETGVEVCTARTPRPQTATISVLGAPVFALPPGQATAIEATCTPSHDADIHVIRAFPHMHEHGVELQSEILRSDGSRETVLDIGYDHDHQKTYDLEATLHPGDRLLTTCHFVNQSEATIRAGYASTNEMCTNFVHAWPAHALKSGLIPGVETACVF